MYRRTTRELRTDAIPEPLASALAKHAAAHQLSLDPARARAWLTHSENPVQSGMLGSLFGRRANPTDAGAAHDAVLVLHPTHVLVAVHGDKRGTSVLSTPLMALSVTRGSHLAAKLAPDMPGVEDGITLTGFAGSGLPGHEARPGSFFFGIELATRDACAAALEAAVAAVKRG